MLLSIQLITDIITWNILKINTWFSWKILSLQYNYHLNNLHIDTMVIVFYN
jgi:hypothetical protein